MVDALSRKEMIAYIITLSKVISDFNERIKQEEGCRVVATFPIPEKPWEIISMDFITGFPKLCYNLQMSSTTGMSPFELAIGVQLRMPLEVAKQNAGGNSLTMCEPDRHRVHARQAPHAPDWHRHTDDTQARIHGLHDMCGVHSLVTMARGLVQPTLFVGTRALKDLCNEPVGKAMCAMPWFDRALNVQLTRTYDDYAWNRGTMPCALGRNNHGRNAMARCCRTLT
ncbi:hypothetical protein AAG906_032978 [Vitis piasezkii]